MATFKVVVRKKRGDGFYPVYIRVVHRSRRVILKPINSLRTSKSPRMAKSRILWSTNIVHEKSYVIAI